mmetsp:Transcript_36404/g.109257  ORF Transcript_36404/g.109257 Transcript_36404/m.109257 type:complete len:240 (+) Transcript_36404:296-1015(+)
MCSRATTAISQSQSRAARSHQSECADIVTPRNRWPMKSATFGSSSKMPSQSRYHRRPVSSRRFSSMRTCRSPTPSLLSACLKIRWSGDTRTSLSRLSDTTMRRSCPPSDRPCSGYTSISPWPSDTRAETCSSASDTSASAAAPVLALLPGSPVNVAASALTSTVSGHRFRSAARSSRVDVTAGAASMGCLPGRGVGAGDAPTTRGRDVPSLSPITRRSPPPTTQSPLCFANAKRRVRPD